MQLTLQQAIDLEVVMDSVSRRVDALDRRAGRGGSTVMCFKQIETRVSAILRKRPAATALTETEGKALQVVMDFCRDETQNARNIAAMALCARLMTAFAAARARDVPAVRAAH